MRRLIAMALAFLPCSGQADGTAPNLLLPATAPMLSYTTIGRMNALSPVDLREIEISSSGGQTDVFIRFFDRAGEDLAEWTTLAQGSGMVVSICGTPVLEVENLSPITTGTLYIPNLTFVQADALRSIWHGRATCSTLPTEVFPIGQ